MKPNQVFIIFTIAIFFKYSLINHFLINQVRGTIFNELDDDRLHSVIDFGQFEEKFKLTAAGRALINGDSDQHDGLMTYPSKRMKKQDNVSLLEHTRLRNIGSYKHSLRLHNIF